MSTDAPTSGDDTVEPLEESAPTSRFTLPSAYTILFGLIVIMALATWIIPAGRYALDEAGSPIPGSYQEVDSSPQRIIIDSLEAPINGLYGIEDPETGNVDVFNSGSLFSAIDVALFILVIGGGVLWIVRFQYPRRRRDAGPLTESEDRERSAVRAGLRTSGLVSVVLSVVLALVTWLTLSHFGWWPMSLPASILIVGLVFLAVGRRFV
jgi:uncharacterized ion transporter superfamily protein YfcC